MCLAVFWLGFVVFLLGVIVMSVAEGLKYTNQASDKTVQYMGWASGGAIALGLILSLAAGGAMAGKVAKKIPGID